MLKDVIDDFLENAVNNDLFVGTKGLLRFNVLCEAEIYFGVLLQALHFRLNGLYQVLLHEELIIKRVAYAAYRTREHLYRVGYGLQRLGEFGLVELEVLDHEINVGKLLAGVVVQVLRYIVKHLLLGLDDGGVERFLEVEVLLVNDPGIGFYFVNVELDEEYAKKHQQADEQNPYYDTKGNIIKHWLAFFHDIYKYL